MFIAVSVQLDQGQHEGTIDVYNYVQYMRKQRSSMVLNEVGCSTIMPYYSVHFMIDFCRLNTFSSMMHCLKQLTRE